jgi:hypothetical protein
MASNGNNSKIEGPTDLYELMLEVKNGMANGCIRGCTWITKKQAKQVGIKWSFVEQSAEILGLSLKRHGKIGYMISK